MEMTEHSWQEEKSIFLGRNVTGQQHSGLERSVYWPLLIQTMWYNILYLLHHVNFLLFVFKSKREALLPPVQHCDLSVTVSNAHTHTHKNPHIPCKVKCFGFCKLVLLWSSLSSLRCFCVNAYLNVFFSMKVSYVGMDKRLASTFWFGAGLVVGDSLLSEVHHHGNFAHIDSGLWRRLCFGLESKQ